MSNIPLFSADCISPIFNKLRLVAVPSSSNLAFSHNEAGGDAEPIMSVSLQHFKVY
jgi:hypothetical protein